MTTVEDTRKLSNPYVQSVTDAVAESTMEKMFEIQRSLLIELLGELRIIKLHLAILNDEEINEVK